MSPNWLHSQVVQSHEVPLEALFFQAKHPQLLLIGLIFYTLQHLHCVFLDPLQHFNVFLVVRGPRLNTDFETWPYQCKVQIATLVLLGSFWD